jgi:8-oxo-dGTP pyrophosphatase MutT (NUDIX family)
MMLKPIPKDARCVFKGVIFEVWQWEQKMFDGSMATFERLKRPDTVVIIPVIGNKIILETQEQPDTKKFLSLPSGRCGKKEKPLMAAKRELLEETGYTSDNWELWQSYNPLGKIIWTVHIFVARNCIRTHEPRPDAGEKIITKLITFEEFLLLSDNQKFRGKELTSILLRARLNKKKKKELRRLLF